MRAQPDISVRDISSLYETEPVGYTAQPQFLNAVCKVQTILPPLQFLEVTQRIEKQLGRLTPRRWGPRTIDIDIIVYGDLVYKDADLELPHPRMSERLFVLIPLVEISPQLVPPLADKLSVAELLIQCSDKSKVRVYKEKNDPLTDWGAP